MRAPAGLAWPFDPDAGATVTFCQSGLRNSATASALRRAGFDIIEIDGSYPGWARWSTAQAIPTSL